VVVANKLSSEELYVVGTRYRQSMNNYIKKESLHAYEKHRIGEERQLVLCNVYHSQLNGDNMSGIMNTVQNQLAFDNDVHFDKFYFY